MDLERWTKNTTDPRCDFILTCGEQCGNKAAPGVSRCLIHGGQQILTKQERASFRVYNLSKFQNRVNHLSDHPKLKTLNEEIALLRLFIEEKINRCSDGTDLLLISGPISEMVIKVQKLVESCDRLETKAGNLLSKQQIQNLATQLFQAVSNKLNSSDKLTDSDRANLLDTIANEFVAILEGKK